MIHSIKGPNGGFYMDERDLNTTLIDIVTALDGNSIYNDCVLGLKTCNEKRPCPVHEQYQGIKKNLLAMLENNTIGEFNNKLDSGKYFLVNS